MAKGKGIPLYLGFLFSCCMLSTAVLVGVALLLKFAEPLIDGQVTEQMVIKKGSVLYNQLQNPGLPLWKSFYFYNLTNYEKWAAGEELPHVQEVGPYSFRENRTKYIQSLEDDVLVYNQTKYFYWDGENSYHNVTPDDIICTINIPMVAAIAEADKKNLFFRDALKSIFKLTKAHMYICQKVKDLAWNYTDDLVKELHTFKLYPRTYVNIQVNGSSNDSLYSMINTGAKDINLLGNFIQWDGHYRNLSTWPGGNSNPANRICGNEGLFFRPLLKEGDNLTAFIDDVQRSFDLTYVGKVKHLSTLAYRFEVVNSTWQNASINPYNANFGSWGPQGLIYLGPTQYPEIPVFGSKAHFLDGDPALRDCCVGLTEPNRALHDITLDVEPTTGANIHWKQILQINVQVNKSLHFDVTNRKGYNFNNNQTLYFPVMWVSEHAELNTEFQQYLDGQGLAEVEVVREAVPILFWILICLAVLCVLVSLSRATPLSMQEILYKLEASKVDKRGGGGKKDAKKFAPGKEPDQAAAALSKYLQFVDPEEMVAIRDSTGAVVSLSPLTNSENTKVEDASKQLLVMYPSRTDLVDCAAVSVERPD